MGVAVALVLFVWKTPVPVGPTGNGAIDEELAYGAGDWLTGGLTPVTVGMTGNGTLEDELVYGTGDSLTGGLMLVPVGPTGKGTLDEELLYGAGDSLTGGLTPVPVIMGGVTIPSLEVVFGNGTTDSVIYCDGLPVPVTKGTLLEAVTRGGATPVPVGPANTVLFAEELAAYEVAKCTRT